MELLLAAQFDTGFYRRIRFVGSDGATAVRARGAGACRRRAGVVRALAADRVGARRGAGVATAGARSAASRW